jgi:pyrrolidone-carboxylate peptidase
MILAFDIDPFSDYEHIPSRDAARQVSARECCIAKERPVGTKLPTSTQHSSALGLEPFWKLERITRTRGFPHCPTKCLWRHSRC